MTNIVHFGKFYKPDSGGIERVTLSLAKGAVRVGHTVVVVCFKKTPAQNTEVIDGVKIIRAPVAKIIASQPLGVKYFFQCYSAALKADVVHFHAPNMLGALCAILIPAKTRLLVHWHSDVINKGLLGKIFRPLEFALLRRANIIVATSQVYADASEMLARFNDKITIVPIGLPETNQEGRRSQLPTVLESQIGNRKIVLAVGRLVPYKGFDVLIKAAQHFIKNSVVVIVGSGPMQKELQNIIVSNGVGMRVVLTGRLDDSSLHALFERATLYCLPSITRAEAFGVVLLEAMSYGLPIVTSNIPGSGVTWINQHGICGLNFPIGDTKLLADACNRILESEELRSKFSNGARQRFLTEFTEDVSIERIIAVYKRILIPEIGWK